MPRGVSRLDEARLQQRLWAPDLLRPNLSFWQDAADISTITIATGVSEWRDKSGNGRNFTQATGANQPAYSETGFLGRPSITFDGINDNLSLSGINAQIANQTHGVYWVFRRISGNTGGSGYNPAISVASSVDAGALHYVKNTNFPASYPYFGQPTSNSYDLTTGFAYQNDTGYVMSFQANAPSAATGWSVHRSGTLEGTTNAIGTPNANNVGYVLAHQANPTRYLNCVFGEVLMVQNANARVRQLIEGYLAAKWGVTLAASHPFANRPPLIGD